MPIDLMYDISVETDETGHGKCIHAPESVFRQIAGILIKLATEKPDTGMARELNGLLEVDHITQAHFFAFALQCLGDALCSEDDPMPQNLRTKPDDSCVLQQEQGGEYVDVFDFGACLALWVDTIQQQTQEIETIRDLKEIIKKAPEDAEKLLEKFEDLYEGTSESYDPSLVNDTLGKKAALCNALREVINGYVIEAQRLKQQEIDGNNTGVVAIGVAAAILGLMGAALLFPPSAAAATTLYGAYITAGTAGMASGLLGVSGAALAGWTEIVKATSLPILQDNAAKEDILCVWYEALKNDNDISHSDFRASLDMSGQSANAQALFAVIDSLRQVDLAYPAFLENWASKIAIGDAGAIYDECGCEDPGYEMVTMPGYNAIIDRLGTGSEGDVYEITLASSEQGHVTWIRVITDVSNRDFKIKNLQRISNIKEFKMDTPTGYQVVAGQPDPDAITQAFIFEATANPVTAEINYPAKIRITIEVVPV